MFISICIVYILLLSVNKTILQIRKLFDITLLEYTSIKFFIVKFTNLLYLHWINLKLRNNRGVINKIFP
jgi:hypothetical protein